MEKWLRWATEIDSIAQAGLASSKDVYDIERFKQLKNIASEIISESANLELHKVKKCFALKLIIILTLRLNSINNYKKLISLYEYTKGHNL